MKRSIFALLIFSYSSLFAAATNEASVRISIAEGLKEANMMFEKGQYDSAWTLLTALIREEPTNAQVNVLMLKVANKSGRLNQALAITERLVAMNPNNARLHFELAKGYAIAGDKENSNAQMQIAKQLDPKLSDANLEYELQKLSTKAQNRGDRLQVAGNISFGFIYNSNVNSGIDGLDIEIGNLNLKLNDQAEKKAGFGEYISANVNAGYKLSQNSPWWIVGDINVYGIGYNNKVPSNQYFGWGRGAAGMRYVGEKDIFELRLKVENGIYRPKENMLSGGAESIWIHAFSPNWQSILRGSFERRNYKEQSSRDGNYYTAGGYLRYLWGGATTNYVMFGARILGAAATKEKMYSYSGWESSLRLSFSPIAKLDIAPFIAYREQKYKGAATTLSQRLGEDDRDDKTYISGAAFVWHWNEAFSNELGYQYIKNRSNSDLYKYNQHQVNFGLTYSF